MRRSGTPGAPRRSGCRRCEHRDRRALSVRGRFAPAAATFFALLTSPNHARPADLGGQLALSSQLVERGIAITPPKPAVQGALSLTLPSGWSFGLSAAAEVRSPGHVSEAVARLSHSGMLSGDWQMQTNLLYYHYSGITRLNAVEAGVGWVYRDILSVGLSGIYALGTDERRLRPALDTGFRWPLTHGLSFSAGAGFTRYVISRYREPGDAYHSAFYLYGNAGLQWSRGPWQAGLSRMFISPGARRQLDYLAASPWLATLSRAF